MKRKHWVLAGLTAAIVAAGMADVVAGPAQRRRARFQHADKNNDGKVGPAEWRQEKRWELKQKAKVNTPREAKADANDDGIVQPAEARRAKAAGYLKNASAVNRPWEGEADANDDGTVSAAELRAYRQGILDRDGDGDVDAAERKAFWRRHKSKVDTAVEQKYDVNEDGWISGEEARELLKDRLRIINTRGRAKVDSAIEAEYDANGDGVIDKDEADAIRDALAEPVD